MSDSSRLNTSPPSLPRPKKRRPLRLLMQQLLKSGILGRIGTLVLKFYSALYCLRFFHRDRPRLVWPEKAVIFSLWHSGIGAASRALPKALKYLLKERAGYTLISEHRDGEFIAQMVQGLGLKTVRGSSRRGGTGAFIEMVHLLEQGHCILVTPDGPKGPREEIKDGILQLALHSGCPIIPVGVAASPAIRLQSWDRFLLALPFSKVIVTLGEPITLDPAQDIEQHRTALQTAMQKAGAEATERLTT